MTHVVSLKEIALQAGVSLATVDRVLHGRPGTRTVTRDRVLQARAELERQRQQLARRGRRFLIDLVMEAPLRFSRLVRTALDGAMQRAQPAVFRAREHLAETWPHGALAERLDALGRCGSQGVLLKGPDTAAVREAVAGLQARGIPVLALVTDLPGSACSAYVGLDNRAAGRTAAWLMAPWLRVAGGEVLLSSSGPRFRGEIERIEAFVEALGLQAPRSRVHLLDDGQGLHAPTVAGVRRLLVAHDRVSAVYSVGGANAAILEAFDWAGRVCGAFVGHDLDEDNRALLRQQRLSAVLHHDLDHDLDTACRLLMQAHGVMPRDRAALRSGVEVITPFNLPPDLRR
ncbi:regulatory protein LacI [Sphaerotilus natans subsp. natans DSM 6575]|uniref:Regulatory protein LacI n=1 Tax=Sphaerotilus natans subsp. natans DSM 6575 TaxID=1286631 RepID=A0A059KNZ7_9BURK|nr:LacI family DNA-binding transcriptional regulator [Sphaerotilus natans]KDB53065.1 regulatory protein LacI [Sphaerotilus natans subsp. natans DSM 6575]SIQ28287.1 LacI family transcriptional regulator [Sphaerotilus natans]